MRTFAYRVAQTFSVIILVLAELLLSLIAIWLVRGRGVIACGKGIFDSQTWLLDLTVVVGIPVLFIVGAGSLFFWCSARLTRLAESTSHS